MRFAPGTRALVAVAVLVALVAVVVLAVSSSGPGGSSSPTGAGGAESISQDDQHLLYASPATVARTLDTMRKLGVDRVRLTIRWFDLAPANDSPVRPTGFDAANPADYPAAVWNRYDIAVALALTRGIGVEFNVTAPGPLWAMAHPAPSAREASHYMPSAGEYGQFVSALGTRYSGVYVPSGAHRALPRVGFWTIWNEPNQPGWLSPQWGRIAGQRTMIAPRLYRAYVDAAFAALKRSGHVPSRDTILIGELAPEGSVKVARLAPIPPMPFLRALYCVDQSYRPLQGDSARALSCPTGGEPSAFVAAHPALFEATGFAHHPYSFFLAPNLPMQDPDFVPLANLSRLEHGLDGIFGTYGVQRRLPIYVDEYGYETNPPNPYRGVSLRLQSLFLNEAQYLAWKDPRIRSFAQFLLYDSAPDPKYRRGSVRYWSTFQTGLLFLGGRHKPSFNAYRLPIFIPNPGANGPLLVWGMLRAAPDSTRQQAQIQWRPRHGHYRTLTTVSTVDPSGFLTTRVSVPGTGTVRIAWSSAAGRTFHSRSVSVGLGAR